MTQRDLCWVPAVVTCVGAWLALISFIKQAPADFFTPSLHINPCSQDFDQSWFVRVRAVVSIFCTKVGCAFVGSGQPNQRGPGCGMLSVLTFVGL